VVTSDRQPAIEVSGVHKSFGQQKVLKGIDLLVRQGEILSVLGRSGTGKSVLLRLLVALEKPDAGFIRVNGTEVTNIPRKQLSDIRKVLASYFNRQPSMIR
jgi:ABC-type transporter Mla maintaining outer membrane lipid asymmetry ATPase subunit MlaF